MSKIFLSFILLSPLMLSAQDNLFKFPIDSTTGKISFQGVVNIENVSKAEIYNRLKLWIINNYNSPKDVINSEDKEIGIIKLKPVIKKQRNKDGLQFEDVLYFDLIFMVKDNKYKYVLNNIQHSLLTPHAPADKSPIERPFLISKDDTEQMKYFEYRNKWSNEIKGDIEALLISAHTAAAKKSETDF